MRRFACLVIASLLLATPALAAEFVWTTEEASATRFLGADSKEVGTVESGKRVEVLFREGDRIRVKLPASSKFGWIDAGSTSETAPEGSSSEPVIDLGLPPIDFTLPGSD
jgi:hypothetical protein